MKDEKIDESGVVMESVPCALCRETDAAPFMKARNIRQRGEREYDLVKCRSCGFVYLNPRPSKESISCYYVGTDTEKANRPPTLSERFYFGLFRRLPHKKAGSMLDVGCGSGRYIYLLKERGWDVKGVDLSFTEYGRDVLGVDIFEGGLTDAGYADGSFDVVTFWWTLEHMHDPVSVLKEARRVLKKGGLLIVGVPNIESIEASVFKRNWFHLYIPKHINHFSQRSLDRMLKIAGFEDVRIRHDMFSFGIIGSIQCAFNSINLKIDLRNPVWYLISLPLDMVMSMTRRSGLITAYAVKR